MGNAEGHVPFPRMPWRLRRASISCARLDRRLAHRSPRKACRPTAPARGQGESRGLLPPGRLPIAAGLDDDHGGAIGGTELDAKHRQRLLAVMEQDFAEQDVPNTAYVEAVTSLAPHAR